MGFGRSLEPSDGRRPIYLCSLFCLSIGSLGVALAQDVPQLLAFRVLQAFGTSSGLSVGMGVIGDIYKLEERGTASGIFFGVSHCSPLPQSHRFKRPDSLIPLASIGSPCRPSSCPACRRRGRTLLLMAPHASNLICIWAFHVASHNGFPP